MKDLFKREMTKDFTTKYGYHCNNRNAKKKEKQITNKRIRKNLKEQLYGIN